MEDNYYFAAGWKIVRPVNRLIVQPTEGAVRSGLLRLVVGRNRHAIT